MKKRRLLVISIIFAISLFAVNAFAAPSVEWVNPTDGSSYAVGTYVDVTGQAACTGGVGGAGLDLVLVLDSSGSMATSSYDSATNTWKTRSAYMKEAAIALVDSLPVATSSVSVVEFDSDANTMTVLLQLSSNMTDVKNAINSVDASGGTYIGSGITAATAVLTGSSHTDGRSQMMVVVSDGETSSLSQTYASADAAMAAGVDAIHTVGIPGHSVSTMSGIAGGSDRTYSTTADNYGVYTNANDLTTLQGIFDGTGGSLVGIDYVTVKLDNGTILNSDNGDFVVSGLGTFEITNQLIALGANDFVATAYCTDGFSDSDTLTLYGAGQPGPVPEPGTLILFGVGLLGVAGASRKKIIINKL